jgi:hypothetical protein
LVFLKRAGMILRIKQGDSIFMECIPHIWKIYLYMNYHIYELTNNTYSMNRMIKKMKVIIKGVREDMIPEDFDDLLSEEGKGVGFAPDELFENTSYSMRDYIADYLITALGDNLDAVNILYVDLDHYKIKITTAQKCWENVEIYAEVVRKLISLWISPSEITTVM